MHAHTHPHTAILSSCYFPPVQWVSKLLLHKKAIIDHHEYFVKQTYRTRFTILGANKPISLTIPVKKTDGNKTKMKDVLIDYDTRWQHNHIRSVENAYQSSPFFEYTWEELKNILTREEKFLIDLNEKLLACILDFINVEKNYTYSEKYIELSGENMDYRDIINPKKSLSNDPLFKAAPYMQVFQENRTCIPNLSILDLLFNEGPQSRLNLLQCLVD
ncbi:MAG: hypothetical protein GVY19_01785 [Bacteroidetes bacterium]|jgi:hypothetical protein|nr:hypothetical protein [Bacteroidota bacterium]